MMTLIALLTTHPVLSAAPLLAANGLLLLAGVTFVILVLRLMSLRQSQLLNHDFFQELGPIATGAAWGSMALVGTAAVGGLSLLVWGALPGPLPPAIHSGWVGALFDASVVPFSAFLWYATCRYCRLTLRRSRTGCAAPEAG